jgi:hypothetical protein
LGVWEVGEEKVEKEAVRAKNLSSEWLMREVPSVAEV